MPAWVTTPAGAALLGALNAASGATRLVGGAVRDGLLGLAGADIDLATQLPPQEVMARVTAAGLKAVPTGLAHGTVTVVGDGLTAEVTTLRRDLVTDGRHAEVAFTDDWQADASRRDFTINALYACLPDGQISDFFGGIADLAAQKVRFIGDPLTRIAEDHLRILRFFRFSARFATVIDADGLTATTARANDLMALSRERIAGELRGILAVADPVPVLAVMLGAGIWRPVIPEIDTDRLPFLTRTIAAEAVAGIAPSWQRRFAALLPTDTAATVTARLRLSNADRARIATAATGITSPRDAALWADGAEAVADRLLIAGDAAGAVAALAWPRPRLPVSGRDILARGVAPGREVAARLAAFERVWVAAGFPDDAVVVAALLDGVSG